MNRVAVIGTGLIGAPIVEAIAKGAAGDWILTAVLNRSGNKVGSVDVVTDPDTFFASQPDLVIDAAGVGALRQFGERCLAGANLWTISAAALADDSLYDLLEETGKKHGHRLRIVSGAIAGLDGIAAISLDEAAQIKVSVDLAPSENGRELMFDGSARDAAIAYPEHVNVAAATALAGVGLDETQVEVIQPASDEGRSISLKAHSRYGQLQLNCIPGVVPGQGIHLVAASVIAALRQEQQTIWVG